MNVEFVKMNGAGNDFILIDNRDRRLRLDTDTVKKLCHRQRGIGADGLIMLVPCENGRADWSWEFYNSDGSVAEMCGNGARCFAKFIQKLTGVEDKVTFETLAGVITAKFCGDNVAIELTNPKDLQLNIEVPLKDGVYRFHFINTGVPHTVTFVENADNVDVKRIGAEVRWHQRFAPKGTNVNFVQVKGDSFIRVRTYERGVEDETLACGTGITASALITSVVYGFKPPIKVAVQSGDIMEINFEKSVNGFTNVMLTGPAEFVFTGRIEI